MFLLFLFIHERFLQRGLAVVLAEDIPNTVSANPVPGTTSKQKKVFFAWVDASFAQPLGSNFAPSSMLRIPTSFRRQHHVGVEVCTWHHNSFIGLL